MFLLILLHFRVTNSIFEFILFIVVIFNRFIIKRWFPGLYYNVGWVEVSLSLIRIILLCLINLRETNHNIIVLARGVTSLRVFFFGTSNLIAIYIAYERLIFFILLIIFLYGRQPEKVGASFYIITYTGGASLPFLYVVFNLETWPCSIVVRPFFGRLIITIFAVKSPIFMLHVWLPKAHVEAPTVGSILLAGILLKVGVYGTMRVLSIVNMRVRWVSFFSFLGFLFSGIFSLTSSDTKVLRAYSRVVHINLVLYGLSLVRLCSRRGSVTLCVAHGFVSTLLFYIVGILYRANGSRIIYISRGLRTYYPYLLLLFLGVVAGNIGVPPLLSFWGELVILTNIFSGVNGMIVITIIYFVYVMLYSIYLLIHRIKRVSISSSISPIVRITLVWVVFILIVL